MKRAVILKHAPFEGPGRLGPMLAERGHALCTYDLHLGAGVPEALSPEDVLVVMGGPMGIADLDRPELSFLRREVELLARCIERDHSVIGICLGAQLLAFAAGASVRPMTDGAGERCYEVGWGPVQFHATGSDDPVLRGLPRRAEVLHWHGDAFDVPANARLLASSETCPSQAFRLKTRLFGLQFHCEVDAGDVAEFLRADRGFVERAGGPDGADRIRSDTKRNIGRFLEIGDRLLGNILDIMTE